MKRTITLTESDIRNMVAEAVAEYCGCQDVDEGRLRNAALGLGLAASVMTGASSLRHYAKQHPDRFCISTEKTVDGETQDPENTTRFKPDNAVENSVYTPSTDLINYIKKYETFHKGWVKDANGHPTTGWGFKITPELKKRYPNGMHTEKEADKYLYEYIQTMVPEFIKNTPNIELLPQHVKDALFDLYYNVGGVLYTSGSPNLQKALKGYSKTKNLVPIIDNLKYSKKHKGLKYRSSDRREMAHKADYNRDYNLEYTAYKK